MNPARPTPHASRSICWRVEIARDGDCFCANIISPSIHTDALTSLPTMISQAQDGIVFVFASRQPTKAVVPSSKKNVSVTVIVKRLITYSSPIWRVPHVSPLLRDMGAFLSGSWKILTPVLAKAPRTGAGAKKTPDPSTPQIIAFAMIRSSRDDRVRGGGIPQAVQSGRSAFGWRSGLPLRFQALAEIKSGLSRCGASSSVISGFAEP
jgi:hypothetical protein